MQHLINHNKTLLLIDQLLPREVNKFKQYLTAPANGFEQGALKTFDILVKHVHEKSGAPLAKEDLYRLVFGKKPYNDIKMRHVLSNLNKGLMNYWALQEYEKHPVQFSLNLGAQLLQRNLYDEYDRQHSYHLAQLQKTPHAHADYYLYLFQLEFQELESTATIARRRSPGKIESILGKLDTYYLIKKLQLCCEILNMQNMMAAEMNVLLFDEIMLYVEKNKAQLPVAGMVYYYIINMLRYPEINENYTALKDTLEQNISMFPEKEIRELYSYALNYCIKQINLGHIEFQKELLNNYKTMLQNNMMHVGRHIPEHNFKNIVTVALREQQNEWAQNFIDTYIKQVAPDDRNNAYNYNIANCYFSRKEYKQALQHLQKVQFNDPYYALDTRCMMMKIYFELREEQVLDSHISAFRVFLHRSKVISDFQRTIYKNLVNFTSRMMHAIDSPARIGALKKSIESTKQVADLRWLNEKMAELKMEN